MQRFIYFFMIFALSLAADLYIYDDRYYTTYTPEPVFRFATPWKFGYNLNDRLYLYYQNKLPSVTARVSFILGLITVERTNITLLTGKIFTVTLYQLIGPEIIMDLDLYSNTSNRLCASIRVAEGRVVSTVHPKGRDKEYKYADFCFKNSTCVLLVDLKDYTCKDPSIFIGKNRKPNKTLLTDLENNNKSFVTNVSPSSHGNVKTSTNNSANNTDVKPTNNTVIIIGSLSGITLTVLAIISIWRRCWIKRCPQDTLDLPTNHHSEPFYLNMLFRRECDQEIAEIEQHHYEEITPRGEGG